MAKRGEDRYEIETTTLEDCLPLVESVVRQVACALGYSQEHREELLQSAAVKLLEREGRALAAFRREASLKTYLFRTIRNHAIDELIAREGKFHPTARARRSAPEVEELERLLDPGGCADDCALAVDEAIEIVLERYPHRTRAEIRQAAERVRYRRRRPLMVSLAGELAQFSSRDPGVAVNCQRREAEQQRAQVEEAVLRRLRFSERRAALESLTLLTTEGGREREILDLCTQDDVNWSDVGRQWGVEGIHQRRDRVLLSFRRSLEGMGVEAAPLLA